jgi:site-specific DNA-adenine methylase
MTPSLESDDYELNELNEMKYGLPYKGSKNKLAERIVSLLPQADHLIDLFCGGCAVTHCALLRRKWPHVHINDIDWRPITLFRDALAGRYQDETRWISREDFQRLKDTDPYVAVVWSFGNNMRDYLYSQDIEPLKRAIHYAMFYGDYEPARELGHDLSFIQPIDDLQKRYLAVKHYFSRLGHFRQQSFEGGQNWTARLESAERFSFSRGIWGGRIRLLGASAGQPNCNTWNVATEWGSFKKKKRTPANLRVPPYRATKQPATDCSTGNVTARCPLWGGQKWPLLTSSVGDYRDVEIPDGSVIYCDIPYEGTNVYDKSVQFDYEAFYDWCSRQTQPLFISSYDMPADRFRCIEEFTHRSTLSASANNGVTERIFIPLHQQPPSRPVQLSLWG